MAYSEFTLAQVCEEFHLHTELQLDLFAQIPEVEISQFLHLALQHMAPLGELISTEKARSEFIIAPLLAEVQSQTRHRFSLFSGVDFPVEPARGLKGACDFIFSRSPSVEVVAPVLLVVEAKREDLTAGMGQCAAEMVAARIFNERKGKSLHRVHGAVTSGSDWRFLRLEQDVLYVDRPLYYLAQVGKLIAIMRWILLDSEPTEAQAA